MKTVIVLATTAALCACVVAFAQSTAPPPSAPAAGRWELVVRLSGAPVKDPAPATVCLDARALGTQPERALLDAAVRSLPTESGAAPQCELQVLVRQGDRSTWEARCNGPRGPMQGAGSGTFAEQSASLQQAFGVDTPMGQRTLTQTVRARRLGACS